MDKNLPQLKKDSVFNKIKICIFKLFKRGERKLSVEDSLKDINIENKEIDKSTFFENIKIKNTDRILMLQRKIKEKQMKISELTDEELEEIIKLYKKQIEDKKIKLKKYRIKLMHV